MFFTRKIQHKRYMRYTIRALRYKIVNECIHPSPIDTDKVRLYGNLIRKYQRRMRWINF